MEIANFIANYQNHPVLFVGTGFSLRYLDNSYTWDALLKKVSADIFGSDEYYYDIKSECETEDGFDLTRVATILERKFNTKLANERNGEFEKINDIFYENMSRNIRLSRFKIYIAMLLRELNFREGLSSEIEVLKKSKKNIASVITTNYDSLIEEILEFNPLVGNDILLSNSYGSVYKIHGCISDINSIILTENDYSKFNDKYELIRAQLLSLFMHNPIIFIGYSVSDENIKTILRTIFTYVEPNSKEAEIIRGNFLLIEYHQDSMSTEVVEHDIDIEGYSLIRINKVKTNNFIELYTQIEKLELPASAMHIRRVESLFKDLLSGDGSKFKFMDDIDNLENSEVVIAVGSKSTMDYRYHKPTNFLENYFEIVKDSDVKLLSIIDDMPISSTQWFPIFAFSEIHDNLAKKDILKAQQIQKIKKYIRSMSKKNKIINNDISPILEDKAMTSSRKWDVIIWNLYEDHLSVDIFESFLLGFEDTDSTDYRRMLCFFDYKKYGSNQI